MVSPRNALKSATWVSKTGNVGGGAESKAFALMEVDSLS